MASSKKIIVRELEEWKKRLNESKKNVRVIARDLGKDLKDIQKVALKALK